MKGTREHIKGPNGQSSTMILCLISNGRPENLATFSLNPWPPAITMTPDDKNNNNNNNDNIFHLTTVKGMLKVVMRRSPRERLAMKRLVIVCSLLIKIFLREYSFDNILSIMFLCAVSR